MKSAQKSILAEALDRVDNISYDPDMKIFDIEYRKGKKFNENLFHWALGDNLFLKARRSIPGVDLGSEMMATTHDDEFQHTIELYRTSSKYFVRPVAKITRNGVILGLITERVRGHMIEEVLDYFTENPQYVQPGGMNKLAMHVGIAVKLAHSKGHIHGDIKGDNIILNGTSVVMLDPIGFHKNFYDAHLHQLLRRKVDREDVLAARKRHMEQDMKDLRLLLQRIDHIDKLAQLVRQEPPMGNLSRV